MSVALLSLAIVAGLVPVAITVAGWYGLHERADTLAHFAAGVSLGALALLVFDLRLAAVASVFAVALAWEWLEPRVPGVTTVGSQDTEADVAVATLAAALLVLVTYHV